MARLFCSMTLRRIQQEFTGTEPQALDIPPTSLEIESALPVPGARLIKSSDYQEKHGNDLPGTHQKKDNGDPEIDELLRGYQPLEAFLSGFEKPGDCRFCEQILLRLIH